MQAEQGLSLDVVTYFLLLAPDPRVALDEQPSVPWCDILVISIAIATLHRLPPQKPRSRANKDCEQCHKQLRNVAGKPMCDPDVL
jgi:hypothetical protein